MTDDGGDDGYMSSFHPGYNNGSDSDGDTHLYLELLTLCGESYRELMLGQPI